MMKLMTYNLLNGASCSLDLVTEVIQQEAPDFLTINEANTFSKNKQAILKKLSSDCKMPYTHLTLSGEYDYHVAVLSKVPFKKVTEIRPLMRAGIMVVVDSVFGTLSIIGTHLTPYTEDLRLPEIDLINKSQEKYIRKVLMGDMNSLASYDQYNPMMIRTFNEMQIKKFTTNGIFRFDAIEKILSYDYVDCAKKFKKNDDFTAPTFINEYNAHTNMRLDYIFISKPLAKYLRSYKVIKNKYTEKASDHYPIAIELA